jgi:hypothetical protein
MSNELSRFNRVRYTLYSDILNPLVIEEPKSWSDDEKEIIRSEKWFGITKNLSNNLDYYGNAFDYIKSVYDISGIKGNIRLEKEERNSQTDAWELSYSGYLDFSTYKQDKNYIKIKFNESQFFKNIESRMKEKYELERLDDLKGNPLPALTYKTLYLQGRDIFRETSFDNQDEQINIHYKGSATWDALYDVVIPLNLVYRSDESFSQPTVNILSGGFLDLPTAQIVRGFGDTVFYTAGGVYYLTADQDKTINVQIRLKFRAKFASPENGDSATFRIFHDTVRIIDGDLTSVTEDLIMQCVGASSAPDTPPTYYTIEYNTWKSFDITYETTMNLLEGDSMGLRLQPFFFPNPYNRTNVWDFEFETIEVLADENDLGETTTCNTVRVFDALDRLLRIVTGQQCFQSNLLSNEWRDLLMTNGFKIRKFTDKNITTSLEEILEGLMAIEDIALIIENNTVRVEKKSYAFNPTISIDVGEVSNIEREIIDKQHLSSIEIGYDFDGKYEEVNGLDEFNIKNIYSTCIDVTESVLKAISKIRADAYGITLAQLKPFEDFPKLDTQYDKINFFLDSKLISANNYELRHWQDDFNDEPTGIFSPATAFNLRLSPFNSLLRKGKTISCGLQKFPTELLKYSSTEGNSQLVTLYPERAVIQNNVLPSPYFLPEQITFEKKITLQQFKQIVNNPYKLIKFVNEFGDEEYGYICPGSQGIKPNKEGKFTLIKANY